MRRVCVVTGARAEYGLLRWVIEGIDKSKMLELRLVATGMHLSPEFGETIRDIEADGFKVDRKVEMLLSSDTKVGVTKSVGLGLIGFADAFHEIMPELIVLLGDRFEIMSAATAAVFAGVPIVHLHGGETTQGAFDEAIRHSITKMSHIHCVATDNYRHRVVQLGESPERVLTVGGLGLDNIQRLALLSRVELEAALEFQMLSRNLLITFHPETLNTTASGLQVACLIEALGELEDTGLLFTMPNADTDGREIIRQITKFCSQNDHAKAFTSLGQLKYLSLMKHCDGVVGNSSSGLIEAPSFKKGTLNIGDRQLGREAAKSVIHCEPTYEAISSGLKKLWSSEFQDLLMHVENPYGNGGASELVVNALETTPLDGILKKKFYDIDFNIK